MEHTTPMLLPLPEDEFWKKIRILLREELERMQGNTPKPVSFEVNGMVKKPVYKAHELCALLQISRQTLHSWVKQGVLKQYKIKSRVYYLWQDIEKFISCTQTTTATPS